MTVSTNLEHMELSIARDTTSLANTAHVSHAGGQKMFAFKSTQQQKQTNMAKAPRSRSRPPPPEQSRSSEWTQIVVVRDSAASRRGEFGSHWSFAETYVNAPVYDGWITEKAKAGERGEFGDKGRVMVSLPHLRVKTEKLIWKKTMFIFLTTILRKGKKRQRNEWKTDLAAFYTWNLKPGLVVIGYVSQFGAARCGP